MPTQGKYNLYNKNRQRVMPIGMMEFQLYSDLAKSKDRKITFETAG